MEQTVEYLPYGDTGFFTKIVTDYLSQSPLVQPFFQHTPDFKGIEAAIDARKSFSTDRSLLVEVLQAQYHHIPTSEKVKKNILSLAGENTFTVTTAHQPNIFMGPLYFIYKILHAVKLADELTLQFPQYKFVPVYYMGSEDADLEELGFVNVGGQHLVWETKQTGAVGRMKVDKSLIKLINAIQGQIGVLPFGNELTDIFKKCYSEGKTIQKATLELTNQLFSNFGLVVLVPDNAKLKAAFELVVSKELTEGFSHSIVAATIASLKKNYKVQAGGREINLFYLIDDKRERIELQGEKYEVRTLGIQFSKEEMLIELRKHPERLSANVILRGAFQETILPNIAFIGGGGELAYWLELKNVFAAVEIPFPVLLLRNSFLLIKKEQSEKLLQLGFTHTDFFKNAFYLLNQLVKRESENQLSLSKEIEQAHSYYSGLKKITGAVDITLTEHVASLEKRAIIKLSELEKKMLRAERNKYGTRQKQIEKLKKDLFPNNSLQERVDNFSLNYATYGTAWLQMIYDVSTGLNKGFGVVTV